MTQDPYVIYNADCPVCSREIKAYSRYCETRNLPLGFQPIHDADLASLGLTPEQAARRLHVIRNGEVLAGVPAFLAMWEDMPRFRPLARILSLPGLHLFTVLIYDHLLAPALFAAHRRRMRRQSARP